MQSILDRNFKYTPSHETDLKKRFAAIRRKQAESAKQSNVKAIRKVGK